MMINKANLRPAWLVLMMLFLCALALILLKTSDAPTLVTAQPEPEPTVAMDFSKFKNVVENENCFKCHGQSKYSIDNSDSSRKISKKMYSELIIKREEFYSSNHREFRCTDCHSEEYGTYPHANELRLEAIPGCIDCHGGDETYAKFKFDQIDSEFQASMHSSKHSEDFTCWMCHDAHTYKINARSNENLKETIVYDNMICLNCHADKSNYQLLTDKDQPNVLRKHEWLPNQASHFLNVRCIECHAKNEDTLLVAHHVVPKDQAVRKCEACHSKNSILNASLYKYQKSEIIQKKGFIKGVLLGETTTVGPDENSMLNNISLILFGLTLLGILTHAILRIKK